MTQNHFDKEKKRLLTIHTFSLKLFFFCAFYRTVDNDGSNGPKRQLFRKTVSESPFRWCKFFIVIREERNKKKKSTTNRCNSVTYPRKYQNSKPPNRKFSNEFKCKWITLKKKRGKHFCLPEKSLFGYKQ